MRRTLLLAVALAASLGLTTSAPASADSLAGTRSELLVERAHQIQVVMHRGHAELVVLRTVYNGGPRHDQAMFYIDLPQGAVATSLRTLGMQDGKPTWFLGELMEAEAAAEKYRELTGIGGYYPKDPALLSWRSQGLLALQVFPCAPLQSKTVGYTLMIPSEYRDGAYRVSLPAMGIANRKASVQVQPANPQDRLAFNGKPIPAGATIALNGDEPGEIALSPQGTIGVDGALALETFGRSRVLVRHRIEAAPKIATVPSGAYVVVLLDRSRSMTEQASQASTAAARAYLSHFSDARVQVLEFDRGVRSHPDRFVSAQEAATALQRTPLQLGNGSNLDAALDEAGRALRTVPRTSPRRVVIMTDALTRSSLTEDQLRRPLYQTGAIVHVAELNAGSPSLVRDDEHKWSQLVRPTGGLVWQAGASEEAEEASLMKTVFEELARPKRLHKLTVTAPGVDSSALGYPDTLDEGQGLADLRITDTRASNLEVGGELWATPFRKVIEPDAAETRLWDALVFGSPLQGELNDSEMMVLAMRGGAVSPVTSYLAIEPGVRPSTEGLEESGGGGSGEGIGLGSIGTIGHGAGGGRYPFDGQAYLDEEMGKAWARCGGSGPVTVNLETTYDEVVDVMSALPRAGNATQSNCLVGEAWKLELPGGFHDFSRRTWSVVVEPS